MVVPRKRFFKRVTRDEASAAMGGLVEAWRTWAACGNGVLTMGHDGWWRWGRRARYGDGGSRERTCGWQRRKVRGGGVIIIVMRLTNSVVEWRMGTTLKVNKTSRCG